MEDFGPLVSCVNLEEIVLEKCRGLYDVCFLGKLKKLKSVAIVRCSWVCSLRGVEGVENVRIKRCYGVNSVSVECLRSGKNGVKVFVIDECWNVENLRMKNLKVLEVLKIRKCGYINIVDVRGCLNLRWVRVSECDNLVRVDGIGYERIYVMDCGSYGRRKWMGTQSFALFSGLNVLNVIGCITFHCDVHPIVGGIGVLTHIITSSMPLLFVIRQKNDFNNIVRSEHSFGWKVRKLCCIENMIGCCALMMSMNTWYNLFIRPKILRTNEHIRS